MNDTKPCPSCKEGKMERGEGKLDQCGLTHLVAVTWTCTACGRKEWERASETHWSVNPEAAMPVQVVGKKR